MMKCPHCHSEIDQVKNGKNRSGSQRFKCRVCSRTYTPVPASKRSVELIILPSDGYFTSVEICAGGGGQALGLEQAGFHPLVLVDNDAFACKTLRLNRPSWNVIEADIRDFDVSPYIGVDLLAGGVPCPPFSVAGQKLGEQDERNLLEQMVLLASICRPKAILIENVKGLLEATFADYRARITKEIEALGYTGFWNLLNASDYGVPQLRPRTIFVALQPQYVHGFEWPSALSQPPLTVGDALYEEMRKCGWSQVNQWKRQANAIAPTLVGGSKKHGGPDLGPTRAKQAWAKLGVNAHTLAEEPPASDFEGMPRLTVKMAAILQGFPDSWQFFGKKTATYRQVGNTFPPPVAKAVGMSIANALSHITDRNKTCQENPVLEPSYAITS